MTRSDRHIPTVIALHCSGASGRQWRGLAAMLSAHAQVIAPDLKAHHPGISDGRRHMSLLNEAAPIIGMIDASASPVHLVGHSYGGAVALRAALERPNHVASLTLYEPTAFSLLRNLGPAGRALHDDIAMLASRVSHEVSEGRHGEAMRGFYDYWQGEGAWNHLSPDTRFMLAARVREIPSDFIALFTDAMQLRQLRRLSIPTLVITGKNSPEPSRTVAAQIARVIPKGRNIELAGAGHMGPVTHRETVAAIIAGHLGIDIAAKADRPALAA
jgi:pimeloyl-ACP methyl ester carboxylesterase